MTSSDKLEEILEELRKVMEEEALSDPGITKDEMDKVIKLAQRIAQEDYSSENDLRERLKKRLLSKAFDRALEDDELDFAAGGIIPDREQNDNMNK